MSKRVRRYLVRVFLVLLVAAPAAAVAALLAFPPSQPTIIFAWGYGSDLHFFEPLQQKQAGIISMFFGTATKANWDGTYLYVDGFCGACGEPYGPRGCFVLAKLPKSFAYASRRPHPRYEHLSEPTYVTSLTLLEDGAALSLSLGLILLVLRRLYVRLASCWRLRPGYCRRCGYDLYGLPEPRCPECGTQYTLDGLLATSVKEDPLGDGG